MHILGVIGGGNMGTAIVRGCIAGKVLAPESIIIAEIDEARRNELMSLGCATTSDPAEACRSEQLLLAVKPQVFPKLAAEIAPQVGGKVVISIMAGRNTSFIRQALGGQARVVRAMPNVASQIGAGMTALTLGASAREDDAAIAMRIFAALGRVAMVDEALMHAVTAVSGSGPAYVFLLAQAMEQAAHELGFDQPTARLLVAQTMFGAGKLLTESDQSAEELRRAVTSPGGTTEAAINVFESGGFYKLVAQALTAARNRGRELDRQ